MKRTFPIFVSGFAVTLLLVTTWFTVTGRGICRGEWTPPGSDAARECADVQATGGIAASWEGLVIMLLGLGFVLLGTFLLVKITGNRFGAVFCVAGLLFLLTGFSEGYTIHGLVESELPGAMAVAVMGEVVSGPVVFVPFAFFFLLYPTGSLPSRRWRPVVWLAVGASVVLTITSLLGTETLRLATFHEHPLHAPSISAVREPVELVALLVYVVTLLLAIASLIIRFRRARGIERLQIRWFAASATFIVIVQLCGPIFWSTPSLEFLWGPLFVGSLGTLPVAATVAILKYRLYDIDMFVNRALVYTALTGALAAFYVGLVFVLQNVLPLQADSDIAVAASTLAAAALFRPLRRRIQNFIDRRFYRRRYDAGSTLTRFGGRLRNQVELEVLERDLLDVVGQTVQPAHASLWLKAGTQ